MKLLADRSSAVQETGDQPALGSLSSSLVCVECGYSIPLTGLDELPHCPACGGSRFRRSRLFEREPTVDTATIPTNEPPPSWLGTVRTAMEAGTQCIAYEENDEPTLVGIDEGWTRIGRSGTADIRLDDATVSRRHALIVRTPEGRLRALDDRSLNGLFVNGERVEWSPLADGDELQVGRYRLFVLQA